MANLNMIVESTQVVLMAAQIVAVLSLGALIVCAIKE